MKSKCVLLILGVSALLGGVSVDFISLSDRFDLMVFPQNADELKAVHLSVKDVKTGKVIIDSILREYDEFSSVHSLIYGSYDFAGVYTDFRFVFDSKTGVPVSIVRTRGDLVTVYSIDLVKVSEQLIGSE